VDRRRLSSASRRPYYGWVGRSQIPPTGPPAARTSGSSISPAFRRSVYYPIRAWWTAAPMFHSSALELGWHEKEPIPRAFSLPATSTKSKLETNPLNGRSLGGVKRWGRNRWTCRSAATSARASLREQFRLRLTCRTHGHAARGAISRRPGPSPRTAFRTGLAPAADSRLVPELDRHRPLKRQRSSFFVTDAGPEITASCCPGRATNQVPSRSPARARVRDGQTRLGEPRAVFPAEPRRRPFTAWTLVACPAVKGCGGDRDRHGHQRRTLACPRPALDTK